MKLSMSTTVTLPVRRSGRSSRSSSFRSTPPLGIRHEHQVAARVVRDLHRPAQGHAEGDEGGVLVVDVLDVVHGLHAVPLFI
jgi:hypothetical protein